MNLVNHTQMVQLTHRRCKVLHAFYSQVLGLSRPVGVQKRQMRYAALLSHVWDACKRCV